MAGQGTGGLDTGPLEIRVGGLRRLVVLAGTVVLFLVPQWLRGGYYRTPTAVCGAFVAVVSVGALVRHLRWRRRGCLVRIDEDGSRIKDAVRRFGPGVSVLDEPAP